MTHTFIYEWDDSLGPRLLTLNRKGTFYLSQGWGWSSKSWLYSCHVSGSCTDQPLSVPPAALGLATQSMKPRWWNHAGHRGVVVLARLSLQKQIAGLSTGNYTYIFAFILHGGSSHPRNQLIFAEGTKATVPISKTPSLLCGWYMACLSWPQQYILFPALSKRLTEAMQQPSGVHVQLFLGVTFYDSFHTITNSSHECAVLFASVLHMVTYMPMLHGAQIVELFFKHLSFYYLSYACFHNIIERKLVLSATNYWIYLISLYPSPNISSNSSFPPTYGILQFYPFSSDVMRIRIFPSSSNHTELVLLRCSVVCMLDNMSLITRESCLSFFLSL